MNRAAVLGVTLAAAGLSAIVMPGNAGAAGCGPGTVYDAGSDMCVAAPAPADWNAPAPPPPPAPPLPPISICPPIPFVAVCFPVN